MLDKIKNVLQKKTEQEKQNEEFQKYIQDFRTEHIPPSYNQVKLIEYLNNPEIDHFISISNRTDGKSFNYIHILLDIAINYGIGLTFVSRNMMLRVSYQDLITDIIINSKIYDIEDFSFSRSQYYVRIIYKGNAIGLLTSLNDASELKYFSNFMKHFPIIVYDEFLALQSEYLSDEWEKLKTIYESIDRLEKYPLITKPKIFYFGNAVNFDSPILNALKLFNILENHKINTCKFYKEHEYKVVLEMNRNENSNKRRNTRAFNSDKDAMTTGQFKTNNYNIATKTDILQINKNPRTFFVKTCDNFLKVKYNKDTYTILLSITSNIEDKEYSYNTELKDNKDTSTYLSEKYYDDNAFRKLEKGLFLYENNFSKNQITSDHTLNHLKILKLIRENNSLDSFDNEMQQKEEQLEENYMSQVKDNIMKKIFF